MLEIRVNNIALDLFPETILNFKINSSLFNFDKLKGSYNLPVSVPDSPKNRRLLVQNLDGLLLDNIFPYHKDSEIWVNGLLFYTGKIEIYNILNGKILFNNYLKISKYIDKIYNKMNDLDIYGGDKPFTFRDDDYNYNLSEFALPEIKNTSFLLGTRYESRDIGNINQQRTDAGNLIFEYQLRMVPGSYTYYPIVPMPYLYKIIQYIVDYLGLEIDYNWFEEDENKNLLLINFYDIGKTIFETVHNTFRYSSIPTYHLKNHV